MIHVFREKDFFLVMIRPFSWRVSQFSIRVVIIIIMDHSYNNNNKWRSDAIFSDPRVWINHGSTMDQHGSTWINRLQPAAAALVHASDSWLMRPASCVRRHASGVMRPASCVRRQTHGSCVMRPASDSTLLIQPIQPPPLSVMTTTGTAAFSHATAPRFAPVELYGMG